MRKLKLAILGLAVLAVLLLVMQNTGFLFARNALVLDLFVISFAFPAVSILVYLLSAFAAGFLVAYGIGLLGKFKDRQAIQELSETVDRLSAGRDESPGNESTEAGTEESAPVEMPLKDTTDEQPPESQDEKNT